MVDSSRLHDVRERPGVVRIGHTMGEIGPVW